MVDAQKFAPLRFKPEDVQGGPVTTRILAVFEDDRYTRLIIELELGSQFPLNAGNSNVLIKAWGHETEGWIGQEVELSLGTYFDKDTETEKETVKIRAVSPAKTPPGTGPLPPTRQELREARDNEMDDSIPF